MTAILAAWKAGAAFLPLDPDLPPARTTMMIADARPVLLITDTPTSRPDLDFLLTALPDNYQDEKDDEELPKVKPDHLAYLMYTSGSTGQPKAVMIQHRGLSNHTTAQLLPWIGSAGGKRMRMATGTSAFIADFFICQLAALAGGHTLVVLTRDQRQDPLYLVGLAADPERAVTVLETTTSQLQLLVEAGLLSAPHPPRLAAFGGEACPPDLWAALSAHPSFLAFNSYGPAETTVEATMVAVADSPVPLIGRAFGNAVIRILDGRQRPVPPGTTGELLHRRPWRRPRLPRPGQPKPPRSSSLTLTDPPGSRLYRTGDLARFTRDGLLEYHGRNDHQIKILGQRVEPEEVETALRAHPAIAAAAVTAHATPAGTYLTAHLIPVGGTTPEASELRTWLAQYLPAAAIPALFRYTDSFPFTIGGKLDRKTLTAAAAAETALAATTPPSTPAEHAIAAIWADLLGREPGSVGTHDDFFALGGHSLLAARLALRLSAEHSTDLPLHEIFAHPTIAGQAAWIDEHADAPAAAPIPRLERQHGAEVPASYAQERLWFLWQLAPDSATYHISWCYEATGLDVAALAAAIDAMVERHEIFRTTLHEQDGQIMQRIGPAWRCGLTATPASAEQATAAADAAASELFDLSTGPLLRVRAWETGPAAHLLLFTAHHVVIDEWSLEVFESELWALYAAGGDTAAAALPELAVQYADYAAWHRELTAATADDDAAWWQQTLDGAAPASPAPDHPAPDRTDFAGDHVRATAEPATIAWLEATRTSAATTDFVVLLALYSVFLARQSGRRDVTIGTPVSGRSHPDAASLIGFLVNTLTFRITVDPARTFPEQVAHVRQVVLDAFAHQEIPFEHVVRAVAPQRNAARNPLFTVSYSHETTTPAAGVLPGGLTLTPHSAGGGGGSHFDLSLMTARTPDGLYLGLDYSTVLYDRATITGYLDSLTDLLATLSTDPDTRVSRLLEPTAREADRLRGWNDTAAPTTTAPLHDLVAIQAAATPDATAIEAADGCLTYRQLDSAATGLARRLRRAGVRDGDIVGVHLRPSAVAITVILAAWKAGAAFLPLDPDLPPARITVMITDAQPALLITDAPSPRPDLDFLLAAPAGHDDGDQDDGEDSDAAGGRASITWRT